MTTEKMITELRLGGYLDAADYIERLAETHRSREYGYITAFALGSDFAESICLWQLRALWTAYCLHHNLDVDTREYDEDLRNLWAKISSGSCPPIAEGFEAFDAFMSEHLV